MLSYNFTLDHIDIILTFLTGHFTCLFSDLKS
jgi:hypothetical protein